MPRSPLPAEHQLRMHQARIIGAHRRALLTERDLGEAIEAKDSALRDLAAEIAAAAPLLTDEQREQLRPLLAGIAA